MVVEHVVSWRLSHSTTLLLPRMFCVWEQLADVLADFGSHELRSARCLTPHMLHETQRPMICL